ncbi:MAG: excinuclease ABC subunit UvrC [Erysipelotrichaceae bacterium]
MGIIQDKLALLPALPGCYLMKDKQGTIIYVGKAKKLKNRVKSYFMGAHDYKTTKLVSNIVDFEYIVTNSEKDALVLEINLIKKYHPEFNIMFKDDKSYPYLKLTNEKAPILKVVRKLDDKKATYFGPFPDSGAAYQTLVLLNRLYPLRKCKILPNKVCLYYHMKQCLGPCVYEIDPSIYATMAEEIKRFLRGDVKEILKHLQQTLDEAVESLAFEKAKETHELIEAIKHVTHKQQVQFSDHKDRDVFAYYVSDGYISIQGFFLRNGKLLERTFLVEPLYEEAQDALVSFIIQYYERNVPPQEIVIPLEVVLDEALLSSFPCKVVQPHKGEKRKLVEMVSANAKMAHEQKFELVKRKADNMVSALDELAHIVGAPVDTIELFDNSHLSGTNNVSGMVVFKQGKPYKKGYRTYKLDGYESDLKSMEEVLYRRYLRALKEQSFPDLLLVDGGFQQIKVAKQVLEGFDLQIPIYGLVKNDRHQTANLMNVAGEIIEVAKDSTLFFLLTEMQNEVHRFAISFHKKQRNKAMTKSILDDIDGIGPVRKKAIWKHFVSLKALKAATIEELEALLPKDSAQALFDVLQERKETEQ